jgi:LPXTG-site transpeptidase (sortase) family protein
MRRRLFALGLFALFAWLVPTSQFHLTLRAGAVSCDIHAALNPADCPATLRLPTLDLETPLTAFPVADGTWQISPWEPLVGHFQYTDWFGAGNAVVGGHATYPNGTPGIFYDLQTLQPGDPIFIERPTATTIYIVQRVYVTDYRDLSPVYRSERPRLTLITCDPPSYDPATNAHHDRVVVQAVRLR